jgi:hypothetical protein
LECAAISSNLNVAAADQRVSSQRPALISPPDCPLQSNKTQAL